MAVEVKLPEVAENVDSGQIVKVLVKVGDVIVKDQAVLELETGKASVEVPSPAAGRVLSVHVEEGTTAKVGQLLITLEEDAAQEGAAPAREAPRESALEESALEESALEERAPLPAPQEPPPARVPQGPRLLPSPDAPPAPTPLAAAAQAIAAPHVRQFAREIGVDIGAVRGSGPGARISVEDVKRHARQGGTGTPSAAAPRAVPLPDFARFGPIERAPMTAIRQVTAAQLGNSWASVPHVMLEASADVTELEAFRQKYRAPVEVAGGKLTVTAILVKAVAGALRAFPHFNASVDLAHKELVLKKYVNIGIAADTPRGLLVPVVRDVDKKTLVEVAVEVSALAEKARSGKLSPSELAGGNFTVTNLGGMGIGHFTAIINWPEVAILAVGKARIEAVHRDGAFVPRLRLPLSLSIDHRVVDGADGARFLGRIVEAIEAPYLFW
jgi:pyruvate dehydrogenase E2 component (dihydrolipoamide acetyltransferase)